MVGTRSGLARFDGVKFEKLPLTNFAGISNEEITALLSDQAGGLWVAMNRGPLVNLKSGHTEVMTNLSANNTLVPDIVEAWDNSFYVTWGDVLVRIKNGQLKEFTAKDGIPDGSCSSLVKDTKGRVWLSKGTQVGVMQDDHFEKMIAPNLGSARLTAAQSGGIWICSDTELFAYGNDGVLRKVGTYGENPSFKSNALLEGRDGSVWIGTRRKGLFCFDGSAFHTVPTSHNTILCLTEDRENNIWVGTSGGGLNRVRSKLIHLEGAETGLPSEAIQSICEDSHNHLWGLSQSGFPLLRTNGGWASVSTNLKWSNLGATCLTADRGGALWMGTTSRKLVRWQDSVFTSWGEEAGIANTFFRKIMASSKGDLWIGKGPPESLQRFHDGVFKTITFPQHFHHIQTMAEDDNGDVFIAGENGDLVRVVNDHVYPELNGVGAPTQTIRCLATTPEGNLWIGYEGAGLGRLDKKGRFTLIGREQGLYDDRISQIIDDGRGSLWFGSDHGIFRVQKKILNAVAEGRLPSVHSIHYGADEGLPPLRVNPENAGGAIRSNDGQLWLPMGASLAVINPANLHEDPTIPTVVLTKIDVDEHTIGVYGGGIMQSPNAIPLETHGVLLNLRPSHHRLDFNFTTLSFAAPENISFRYKLEGLDDSWTKPSSQRSATYSRLSAGNYRFRVIACSSSGIWNEVGASFGFTVIPFFWQTWWFRLAAGAFFVSIIFSLSRFYSYRNLQRRLSKLEQQAALDKERARIARDLHDDLGGCLTQIVMVSGLNQRGRISMKKANDEIQTAARYAIKSLDQAVWAVNPQNDTVPAFINYTSQFVVEFLRTAGVACDVDIPEQLPNRAMSAQDRQNLFLVIKEAVNNVVRHAQASEVKFQVTVSGEELHILIRDNGRGFNLAPTGPDADGLRNMLHRMNELAGKFHIESVPGAGTRITLHFLVPPQP